MANYFYRKPNIGGDDNSWAPLNDAHILAAIGEYNSYLYDDSGTLKLALGRIGINDDSTLGVVEVDTVTTLAHAALTNSNWAKVEMTVSGTTPSFTIVDFDTGVETDLSIPPDISGNWDGSKRGYYIDANKRLVGLIWIDSNGDIAGILNVKNNEYGFKGYVVDGVTLDNILYIDQLIDRQELKAKYQTGGWDMDASTSESITHQITNWEKIIITGVTVHRDTGSIKYPLSAFNNAADPNLLYGGVESIATSIITLTIRTGGIFDSVNFDDTSINRADLYLEIYDNS